MNSFVTCRVCGRAFDSAFQSCINEGTGKIEYECQTCNALSREPLVREAEGESEARSCGIYIVSRPVEVQYVCPYCECSVVEDFSNFYEEEVWVGEFNWSCERCGREFRVTDVDYD